MKLILGTRGSKLALRQSDLIACMLKRKFPSLEIEKKIIKTKGDKIIDSPLARIGGKGLFVKEIDDAVIKGEVSFAVHSMKDIPIDIREPLEIVCIPKREDVRDAIVSRDGLNIDELPSGSVIGTSSLRRKAEALNYRKDLEIKDLRGNVDTRIKKLKAGDYDAIIMAIAGLKRLGFERYITQELSPQLFKPSVGQGAIGVVCRKDFEQKKFLTALNHLESMQRVKAERVLLKELGGGCQVPIGAFTYVNGNLALSATVLSPDGSKIVEAKGKGDPSCPEKIGKEVGRELLRKGADAILNEVRKWSSGTVDRLGK
jgi:hydroxymethylbilane synthase